MAVAVVANSIFLKFIFFSLVGASPSQNVNPAFQMHQEIDSNSSILIFFGLFCKKIQLTANCHNVWRASLKLLCKPLKRGCNAL
jgi:hypothetical protein